MHVQFPQSNVPQSDKDVSQYARMQQVCPLLPVSTSEIQSFLPFSALDFFGMMITVEQRLYFNATGRILQQAIFQVLACKG